MEYSPSLSDTSSAVTFPGGLRCPQASGWGMDPQIRRFRQRYNRSSDTTGSVASSSRSPDRSGSPRIVDMPSSIARRAGHLAISGSRANSIFSTCSNRSTSPRSCPAVSARTSRTGSFSKVGLLQGNPAPLSAGAVDQQTQQAQAAVQPEDEGLSPNRGFQF